MARRHRAPDPASKYARDVDKGKVLAGQLVRWACERHLRDLDDAPRRGLHWAAGRAWRAICFYRSLRLTKSRWASSYFELEPWQAFISGSIWGWRRADGYRRFKEGYVEVPRKNGKSEYAGASVILGGFFDDPPEYAAQNYCAATKRDQAKMVFNPARTMARRAPAVREHVHFTARRISAAASESYLEPLGRDSENLDGLDPHFVVVDELHAHANSGIVDVLESATGARPQSFKLEITTAGAQQLGVCWDHHYYATQILDPNSGWKDDALFAYIATIDAGDAWDDPKSWQKANPNFGVTVPRSWFDERLPRWRKSPSARREMMRKNLNVWVGGAESEIDMPTWDKGKDSIDLSTLKGRPCLAGLDLGKVNDPSSLGLVFPPHGDDRRWVILAKHWIPEATMQELESEHRVPWSQWVAEGHVVATPGDVVDDAWIRREVVEILGATYGIQELAFDRHFADALQNQLSEDGISVVAFGQGYLSMTAPTTEFLRLCRAGLLHHGGNPVLRWMAGNLVVERDASGNVKPTKAKSRNKIDGIVALIMALGRAMVAPPPPPPSPLEKHDPFDI